MEIESMDLVKWPICLQRLMRNSATHLWEFVCLEMSVSVFKIMGTKLSEL